MTGDSGVGRHRSARAEGGTLTDDDGIILEMERMVFLLFGRHPMSAVVIRKKGKRVELEVGRRSSGQSCSFASSVHGVRLSQRPSRLSCDALYRYSRALYSLTHLLSLHFIIVILIIATTIVTQPKPK